MTTHEGNVHTQTKSAGLTSNDVNDRARATLSAHARNPQFQEAILYWTHEAQVTNPLCGDHVELKLSIHEDGFAKDLQIKVSGCAMCTASASILGGLLKSPANSHQAMSVRAALMLRAQLETSLRESPTDPWPAELTQLFMFQSLRANKTRLACVMMPWIALASATGKTTES